MRAGVALAIAAALRRYPFRGKVGLWAAIARSLPSVRPVIALPGGARMQLDTSRYWQRLMLAGCFERRSVWLLPRLLGAGDTFIDGGANCGLYSCLAASAVGPAGQVVAFEPDARLHAQLDEQASLNPVIEVRRAALTAAPGSVTFHLPPPDLPEGWGLGIASIERPPEGAGWTVREVEGTTLDAEIARLGRRVTLAKLDLEGHEGPAIEGAARSLGSGALESVLVENNDGRAAERLAGYPFEVVLDVREGFAAVDPRAVGHRHTDLAFLRGAAARRWAAIRPWRPLL